MTLNIHHANFARLADYLTTLVPPPEFGMSSFFRLPWDHDPELNRGEVENEYMTTGELPPCGAVACAVGHGPMAGILDPEAEGWNEYIARNFILDADVEHMDFSDVYEWCFSCTWSRYDNTPEGAAKCIRHMLAHGVPHEDNFWNPEVYADA